MAASEAAVTAVMETLGCVEYQPPQCADGCDWCAEPHCVIHSDWGWIDCGCPVAVAAADAAVDADRASIQAETLRELAGEVPTLSIYGSSVADWLCARADRIEAQS